MEKTMSQHIERVEQGVSLSDVSIQNPFWDDRLTNVLPGMLRHAEKQCRQTGRFQAIWAAGDPKRPLPEESHCFWTSDVAKWLEAVAYYLSKHEDATLRPAMDRVVADLVAAQEPDGYLNPYFTRCRPDERWTDLLGAHELYTAGHLMEAAVALHDSLGDDRLLGAMERLADHMDRRFGPRKDQVKGYPGHQEVELALVSLYRATGQRRYLKLAKYFVDERGRKRRGQGHYFVAESKRLGKSAAPLECAQAHVPVRKQTDAVGHAVRALYLYSGMAEVATETHDTELFAACRALWESITKRRMYVTGGVGSTARDERFTEDYDLPDESAYAETCAAIAMVFFARRMLEVDPRSEYADVMELALYNNVLAGMSLDGMRFFYQNRLASDPKRLELHPPKHGFGHDRQEWFGCACCPPNLARMLASLGNYAATRTEDGSLLRVNLYLGGSIRWQVSSGSAVVEMKTRYPWKGDVRLRVRVRQPSRFTLALRIPGWCRGATLRIDGRAIRMAPVMKDGYALLDRTWKGGETVRLTLPMDVQRIKAHPNVESAAGRVVIRRGPIVYCFEEADCGVPLDGICLAADHKPTARWEKDLLGGCVTVSVNARRAVAGDAAPLYAPGPIRQKSLAVRAKAVPYALWNNRSRGAMRVWMRSM